MRPHPMGQSSNTPQQKPAVEGRRDGATILLHLPNLGKYTLFVGTYNNSAGYVSVSPQILGAGVHHKIDA